MSEENTVPLPTEDDPPDDYDPDEDPLDAQRRVIRAAVRKRLRGEVRAARPIDPDLPPHQRLRRENGNLASDLAFNPLVFPRNR